ncbi:hypothetical protein Tco_0555440 [Tanacetum coccineum]
MRPWNSNPEGLPEWVVQETPEEVDVSGKPYKKNRFITDDSNGLPKQNLVTNSDFYNEPFTFKETEVSIRNFVASPFTLRVRDYDMPDGLKVPTNLKTYDDSETQAEILKIRQCLDESLRDYMGRFGNETLHMTDRSDGMMTGAFISRLCPGRFFKDLIARPPASMEDLFTQAHNFI